MITGRTSRYARAWMTAPTDFLEHEISLNRDGTTVPATVVCPSRYQKPFPTWVVLHGITRPGRAHGQLVRFTRCVASAGMMAIVPEVPEWRDLSLAPHLSVPTVKAAIEGLRATGLAQDEPVGVIGFSFGAPHAIACAGAPEVADEVAGAAGFGGYCGLDSSFRFMMTGRHSWHGDDHFLRPDPYGRWIVAANYLTKVPGYEEAHDVARALEDLAVEASDDGALSWDPRYDATIRRLRAGIDESRREIFDLFAPHSDADLSAVVRPQLAEELAAVARRADPHIDPIEALGRVTRPVHVLHGRNDNLIPYSEAYRLAEVLPHDTVRGFTVTRLFGHSAQDSFPFLRALNEVPVFLRALSGLLRVV